LERALRTQAEQALRGKKSRFDTQNEAPDLALPLSFHRNVFLFFKEALHNIARHSQAQSVTIHLSWTLESLCIEITDDGRGFDVSGRLFGSGLANMRHRADSLHARLDVDSTVGKRTRIVLEVPLK